MSASSDTTISPVAASSPCCSAHGLPTQPAPLGPRHAPARRARGPRRPCASREPSSTTITSCTSGSPARPARHGPIRAASSRAGITTLTAPAVRRAASGGRRRRPRARRASTTAPGGGLGEREQHRPAGWHTRSASVRLNSDVQRKRALDLNDTPGAGRVPRQGARVARGAQGRGAREPRRRRRRGRRPARLAARARRGRPGRGDVARRVRRRRPRAAPAGRGQPGDRPRRRARDLRHHRRGDARADADRARLRGPEAAPPRPDAHRRRGLVPALLRARGGLGPGRRPDARQAAGGRLLAALGPEGVDDERAARRVRPPARPHEPRPAQAQGPDDVRRADGRRGRDGAPAAPDLRRGALQRGLPRRRPPRGGRRGRPGRRRLGRRADHADVRARDDRPRRRGLRLARRPLRPRAARRRGLHARRRDPPPLRRDRDGVPRAALHRLPDADVAPARPDPRRRGRAGQGHDDPRGDRGGRPDRRRARARRACPTSASASWCPTCPA